MHFDFATFLFIATVFTGAVWFIDARWAAPRRRAAVARQTAASVGEADPDLQEAMLRESTFVEYCKSFFPVILLVFLLRSFLVEPFRIPSGSMMPTLLVGDFILVNKFAYGIVLPVVNHKIIEVGAPQRGDVAVFRYPRDPGIDYIKRIVALPGDRISYRDKILYINDQPMAQVSAGSYRGVGGGSMMTGADMLTEQLDGVRHAILIRREAPPGMVDYIVPAGHYFVMGDNRDNSNDSRFWGPVPVENLVGKAFMIWMNWDASAGGVDWNRIGDRIE